MRIQFKIIRLLTSVEQYRLDEEGNLAGWVTDLQGSCLQHCPACCETGCHCEEDTTSPSLSVSLFRASSPDHHPSGPTQAFFRYFNTGPSTKLSSYFESKLSLCGVFAYHCIHDFCFMAVSFLGKSPVPFPNLWGG